MNTVPATVEPTAPILIVGLGETGVAAARWCARQGRPLRIADTRTNPAGLEALREAIGDHGVQYHLGCDTFESSLLDGVGQLVLLSLIHI